METDTLPTEIAIRLEAAARCLVTLELDADPGEARDARIFIVEIEMKEGRRTTRFSELGAPPDAEHFLDVLLPVCHLAPVPRR